MNLSILCFDLDGTLCDLWDSEEQAMYRLIDRLHTQCEHTREQLVEEYKDTWSIYKKSYMRKVDRGEEEMTIRTQHITELLKELEVIDDPHLLAQDHWNTVLKEMQIYPDAVPTVQILAEKRKLTMITNGAPRFQREKINRIGIEEYIEEIIVSGELGHHKPCKLIFDIMTQRINSQPEEMVYIGNDYHKDIIGAHKAGWSTVWVNRKEQQPRGIEPDWNINSLSELRKIF
ncbi:HAD-IA family hydrolase [Candidatus Bathyarchaeota archaeon]|nr:HAD-IA family hydrolase [Candidatus Bathyarchaeota archaeon]